ncbi:NAD(P)/FAD-dependent oxidoreductase [Planktothrix mougeotii]|uniref:FAD-binding oxidoreductase n=1 Tax=Planktothrix mougeotii LEGE 06226 TaxID=1828728 RepID=A0ABR9UHE2_9CYAN|nr:FAD-dependent oxidoreductase [Planktothrix mougeotii]MBE9145887.1 FAD-binding oxidoreductase [Planktothrix mougeotii LEGE 06226]
MTSIAIIGCGIVGATLAYELSQNPDLKITVIDQNPPAQASTGASLGVLMGIISQKTKGRAWRLRQYSMQRYETLIPELEAITGQKIPFNRQGILLLCYAEEELEKWHNLINLRRSQGFELEWLNPTEIQTRYPQINTEQVFGAVYSPDDRQLDPTQLTLTLVEAAQHRGVTFQFGVTVESLEVLKTPDEKQVCQRIKTSEGDLNADWVVMASGLGTTPLISPLETENSGKKPIKIRPVLGQALQVRCIEPLGTLGLEPVITGNDVHIVPLGNTEYWVGATVEFPENDQEILVTPEPLDLVLKGAIAICPALEKATILKTWSGLRPRPEGIPAPVIGNLPGFSKILLATGHYRNGILLAPATAQEIRQLIQSN